MVTQGVKYVLRTDILYQVRRPGFFCDLTLGQRPIQKNPKLKERAPSGNKAPKRVVGEWEKLFEPSCKMYHD